MDDDKELFPDDVLDEMPRWARILARHVASLMKHDKDYALDHDNLTKLMERVELMSSAFQDIRRAIYAAAGMIVVSAAVLVLFKK